MSSGKVDLSQIRGDWDFHSRYVTNAMEQTLKRLNGYWKELKAASRKKGQVPVEGQLMEEFMEACRQTRALCDDYLILAVTQSGAPAGKSASKASSRAGKKTAKKPAAKRAAGGKKKAAARPARKAGGRK